MTDTTENHFVRDLAEQTEQDDPVMVLMRTDDAWEVIALVEIMNAWAWSLRELMKNAGVDDTGINQSLEDISQRIERVLAAHEPCEKAVSA